jgi:hypothetical protein
MFRNAFQVENVATRFESESFFFSRKQAILTKNALVFFFFLKADG